MPVHCDCESSLINALIFFFYANHGYDVIPVCAAVSLNEAAAIFSYKLRSDGRGRVGDGFPTENRRVRYGVVSVGRSPRETKWDESATDIIFLTISRIGTAKMPPG